MTNVIQNALELIRQKLDEELRNANPVDEEWVILSNISDHDGSPYERTRNKVVMLLTNIQQQTSNKNVPAINASHAIASSLSVELFVLFLANFSDRSYQEGIGMISQTISFFHKTPVFTPESLPGLDPTIEKVTMEMNNLSLADMGSLMKMLGVTYLPSAHYKVRIVSSAAPRLRRDR